jgi:Ser/Thr protein kinase RdoA (MazF antagonist)
MTGVAEVIASEMARSAVSDVELAVFSTNQPDRIADITARFCIDHLGLGPSDGLFYHASAGSVVGLGLESGSKVVMKAYQHRWTATFLAAIHEVQRHLAERGFPCPEPLVGPHPIAEGLRCLATIEAWLPDPGMKPLSGPHARCISAAGLAHQIEWCQDLDDLGGLSQHPLGLKEGLYPEPHSPLFDFQGTRRGAEWIDDIARVAVERRDGDRREPVVAHLDWSARNVRLDDERVVAVYDWDSVGFVPESTAVGQAAVTWSVTSEPGRSVFPTAAELGAFVADYENCSGRTLTAAQRQAAFAAGAWTLAYIARCEHSLQATGRARPDQKGARERLRDEGGEFLRPS